MLVLATSTGCLSAGVFSTARAVPRGALEHLAALDIPITVVDRAPTHPSSTTEAVETRLGSGGGPQPSYGLRVGVLPRAELGGRIGPTFVEIHSKIAVIDTLRFAAALSPRITSGGNLPGDTPYYFRLPVLVTLGRADGLTLTPRIGLGATWGDPKREAASASTLARSTRDPFVEAGLTMIVPVSASVAVALEAYVLNAPRERQTTGGFGLGVLFGRTH